MKRVSWQVILGAGLIALSAVIYLIHYGVFGDVHHILIYLVGDIAFVPIEVLLVTLIIHQLLTRREKRAMLNKMNMVIGAFFSEVGTGLLERFARFDANPEQVARELATMSDWSGRRFTQAARRFAAHRFDLDTTRGDLAELTAFLAGKRNFLVRLLENPNLLEHESFTELLWAVFHLTEELSSRPGFDALPGSDHEHLGGDMERAYGRLVAAWVSYLRHLQSDYPYLFSLACRTNPFNASASPVVA